MNRFILFPLCAFTLLALSGGRAWGQKQSEPNVSGPDQWNSQKSTGKSYKKATKRNSTKQDNPSTGQTRRLGNTGDLTKNGNDVNGQRGEASNSKKSKGSENGSTSK